MIKKIYIAGKITGEDRLECAAKFSKAQQKIQTLGFQAVNPLEVVGTWEIEWKEAMKKCLPALIDCDAILVLDGYGRSKGVTIELDLAYQLKLEVLIPQDLQL